MNDKKRRNKMVITLTDPETIRMMRDYGKKSGMKYYAATDRAIRLFIATEIAKLHH
jgi:hypothetical protein